MPRWPKKDAQEEQREPINTVARPRNICLFLPTGKTFTFRNATITIDNETVIAFEYVAMSDNYLKRFTGQKSQIVGWSIF